MGDEPFTTPRPNRPGSSSSSQSSTSPHHAAYASQRSQVLFGCYRRGDANDPERYVAAIAAVLARYDAELIHEVTDPNTGIQTTQKFETFLPNVGELKRYCDAIVAHRQNLKRLGPPIQPRPALAPPPREPGDLATIHVPYHHARYPALLQWSVDASQRLWRMGVSSDGVSGIWVTPAIWHGRLEQRGAA